MCNFSDKSLHNFSLHFSYIRAAQFAPTTESCCRFDFDLRRIFTINTQGIVNDRRIQDFLGEDEVEKSSSSL